ncbi:uncharacterized protein N7473_013018 [Penicillium subrubescens]|uniref:uncharacterized protein n=1 Tax=Penicillium subrubescens TaxID=1316194 RepID=UPI002545902D|nr:uncharacterized protein N7473_013018 [Penicillium subrubescens]KAJ5875671.1 hypothetical protein N7473_013018 [Penicillium subrubescens]
MSWRHKWPRTPRESHHDSAARESSFQNSVLVREWPAAAPGFDPGPNFGAQRTGPFKVIETYPNVCRLALPTRWRIHPVISIEHLQPHPREQDPFNRDTAFEPPEQTDNANH